MLRLPVLARRGKLALPQTDARRISTARTSACRRAAKWTSAAAPNAACSSTRRIPAAAAQAKMSPPFLVASTSADKPGLFTIDETAAATAQVRHAVTASPCLIVAASRHTGCQRHGAARDEGVQQALPLANGPAPTIVAHAPRWLAENSRALRRRGLREQRFGAHFRARPYTTPG